MRVFLRARRIEFRQARPVGEYLLFSWADGLGEDPHCGAAAETLLAEARAGDQD